jgi:DNA-directed RNA polymerase specialized sigma24 family protein
MSETLDAKDDACLIAQSLMGHREAFGLIVERYKTLICSLAYARTGDLSQSEDLAQETFVAAWKQLGNLREPQKLKSWLCGIARNLICDAVKHQGREHRRAAADRVPVGDFLYVRFQDRAGEFALLRGAV